MCASTLRNKATPLKNLQPYHNPPAAVILIAMYEPRCASGRAETDNPFRVARRARVRGSGILVNITGDVRKYAEEQGYTAQEPAIAE